jgi:hypothetical protein
MGRCSKGTGHPLMEVRWPCSASGKINLTPLLADTDDLDSNQAVPPSSPGPLDSPFGSSISSLVVCSICTPKRDFANCMLPQSEFPDTPDAPMPFWALESTLEAHFSDFDYLFPCPLQMDPSLVLDLPLHWAFDTELATNLGQGDTILEESYSPSPPENTLSISPPLSSGLCHPVSRDQLGDQPIVAGSAGLNPPPTHTSPTPSSSVYDDIQNGDSPTSLDSLCYLLRQHYPNRKPPGKVFKSFISSRRNIFQCTLCAYKIGNREQINQHIMKVHCSHYPFVCDFPGWYLMPLAICHPSEADIIIW